MTDNKKISKKIMNASRIAELEIIGEAGMPIDELYVIKQIDRTMHQMILSVERFRAYDLIDDKENGLFTISEKGKKFLKGRHNNH